MTEAEWLACTDPVAMLKFIRKHASERKVRLLAAACCSSFQRYFNDERSFAAINLAYRLADGDASEAERQTAFHRAYKVAGPDDFGYEAAKLAAYTVAKPEQVRRVPLLAIKVFGFDIYTDPRQVERHLLRCIFGNPFRPLELDPAWLTWNGGTVAKLAQAIYDERRFSDMPILADALEEAGCHDPEILGHCRGPGPHVCGCWLVDALIGKADL